MALTNNVLMVLVVGVLVLSVLGTVFNLKTLNFADTSGFATVDYGTVTLTILEQASLILDDDTINFGSCTVDSSQPFTWYNSSGIQTDYNNSLCDATASFPDNISIRNDGNVGIVVTMNASANGSTMFNDPSSDWYYHLTEYGNSCNGTLISSWTAIGSGSITDLPVCTWLQTNSTQPNTRLYFDFAAKVTSAAYADTALTLTFEATAT